MTAIRNHIEFILNDKPVCITFDSACKLRPSVTLLNYLRSLPFHQGVKEGCAEGDCGACTVVIAEEKKGSIRYKTVDSCLVFLPAIHGKQVITVEGLKHNGHLHPVQQSMVEHYGSQCGYCTPGVVMSLFGLYKNKKLIDNETIKDALTGNLCRCTGYRSIMDAAADACRNVVADQYSDNEPQVASRLREIHANKAPLVLQSQNQQYFKPFTLADALLFRKQHPDAVVICGSTDVALRQNKKNEFLPKILDLSAMDDLKFFRKTKNIMVIGSALPLEEIRMMVKGQWNEFYHLLTTFGSLQIRHAGTLGGNIGSASPIGDTLPFLIACNASVNLLSESGMRSLPVEDFIAGYRKTALRTDEILHLVYLPRPSDSEILKFYKVSRRKHLDIATVSAAFRLKVLENRIDEIVLAYGGVAEKPVRALKTEQYLTGKAWTRQTVEEAMKMLHDEFTPISDARADREYRKIITANLLLKFYYETNPEN